MSQQYWGGSYWGNSYWGGGYWGVYTVAPWGFGEIYRLSAALNRNVTWSAAMNRNMSESVTMTRTVSDTYSEIEEL
mgnify:CR=1 FL=1